MENKRYMIEETADRAFPYQLSGYYEEMLIENFTGVDIAIVDKQNKRQTIGKAHITHNYVLIRVRRQNGIRYETSRSKYQQEVPIPTTSYKISSWELDQGPVYIKECDLVVCFDKMQNVQHPQIAIAYTDALQKMYQDIAKMETPTFHLHANDPQGKLNTLFIELFDQISVVHVSHFKDATAEARLYVRMKIQRCIKPDKDGFETRIVDDVKNLTIPIAELYTESCMLVGEAPELYLGTSEAAIDRYKREEVLTEGVKYTKEEHDKELHSLQQIHKKEIESINADYNLEKAKTKRMLQTIKEHELTIAQWKAAASFESDQQKFKAEQAKAVRAEYSAQSERTKHWIEITKHLIPIICLIVTAVIGLRKT